MAGNRRHKWEPVLSLGDSVSQCCECDLMRVRRPGVVIVYRYPSGKSVVAPERVLPCPGRPEVNHGR